MILIKLLNTLGRSDLESMEIADKVSTAVTPDELNVFPFLFLYGYFSNSLGFLRQVKWKDALLCCGDYSALHNCP